MPKTTKRNISTVLAGNIEKLRQIIKDAEDDIKSKVQTKLLKEIAIMEKHISDAINSSNVKEPTKKIPGSSQFEKKMNISPEMAAFAGWDENSLHSRVEVTTVIWNYVKENDLRKDTKNQKEFRPDAKLRQLFNLSDEIEVISYPHIQKYTGIHLIPLQTTTTTTTITAQ